MRCWHRRPCRRRSRSSTAAGCRASSFRLSPPLTRRPPAASAAALGGIRRPALWRCVAIHTATLQRLSDASFPNTGRPTRPSSKPPRAGHLERGATRNLPITTWARSRAAGTTPAETLVPGTLSTSVQRGRPPASTPYFDLAWAARHDSPRLARSDSQFRLATTTRHPSGVVRADALASTRRGRGARRGAGGMEGRLACTELGVDAHPTFLARWQASLPNML